MTTTHTRRTSLYNLRVENVHHSAMDDVLRTVARVIGGHRVIQDQHTRITDHEDGYGYVSVGFRATDDEAARALAERVRPHLPGNAAGPYYPDLTINTGFGIHRREFTA